MNDAYEMIDGFLRNNLEDDDYAEFSAALDSVAAAGAAPASIHDTDRLVYLYSGRKTTSRMLLDLELKLLADTPVTLSEAREAIDHAIANPAPKEPT